MKKINLNPRSHKLTFLLFAILLAAAGFVYQFSYHPQEAQAGGEHNLSGYAWSDNIGWISFNCTNTNSCAASNYGVNVDGAGNISGQAWSDNVGWISFNIADTGSCPTAPCQARLDRQSGGVDGWARALGGGSSQSGGWNGWVHLKGATYGVTVNGCTWGGYAWDDINQGWIHFRDNAYFVSGRGTGCQATSSSPPTATLTATPSEITLGNSTTLNWGSTNATTCTGTNFTTNNVTSGTKVVSPTNQTLYVVQCTGPDGLAQAMSEVLVFSGGTNNVSLSANPSSGAAPLTSTLTATISGTETGPVNFYFWWNCGNATTDVNAAETACGALPFPPIGTCASNSSGAACEGVSNTVQKVSNQYSVNSTAKVIAERGSAEPAQAQTGITVSSVGGPLQIISCSAYPNTVQKNDLVTWSAVISGGNGTYTFNWQGTAPLSGQTVNPATISYDSPRTKTGSLTVTSGPESATEPNCGTVTVSNTTMSFWADPSLIDPGRSSQLNWSNSGFSSCSIDQGIGSVNKTSGQKTVNPSKNTTYTLTCISNRDGTFSKSAAVRVRGQPHIEEVKPQ